MISVLKNYVPQGPFIFCVSGGVDSIAAAHWLKFHYRKNFSLIHFNHKVQEVNDEMEEAAFQFCINFDFGGYIKQRDLIDTPRFEDTSEDGLRKWRLYKMEGIGGDFVTAHHLDDAVENYLMNCFHGTAQHKPIQQLTEFRKFSIYHPFLCATKQDFIEYAIKNDLMKYVVEDPTNKETSQKRNWIRNVIIPEINRKDLGIRKVVRKKFYI